jgi:solute carrier family 35 protein F1/2
MLANGRFLTFAREKIVLIRGIGRPQIVRALRLLLIAIFAQLISALLTCTGIFSTLLSRYHNTSVPTLQNSFNYVSLLFLYTPCLMIQKLVFKKPWNMKWWLYILLSLADVEANYLVVKAYEYTTITSVMLLDCFTIPCVMVLSRILLKRRFYWTHFVGVVICVIGIGTLVAGDYFFAKQEQSQAEWTLSSALFGDLLCIAGAVCYAISNVAQEYVMKKQEQEQHNTPALVTLDDDENTHHSSEKHDLVSSDSIQPAPEPFKLSMIREMNRVIEFLAMLGLFGSIINTIQLFVIERNQVFAMKWTTPVVLYLLGFSVSLFLIYSLIPHLLRLSSATFMNLSFLTSDLFAVLASVFLFKNSVSYMYQIFTDCITDTTSILRCIFLNHCWFNLL